jgi:hypothetical protein
MLCSIDVQECMGRAVGRKNERIWGRINPAEKVAKRKAQGGAKQGKILEESRVGFTHTHLSLAPSKG